jgi:hypothetical protein
MYLRKTIIFHHLHRPIQSLMDYNISSPVYWGSANAGPTDCNIVGPRCWSCHCRNQGVRISIPRKSSFHEWATGNYFVVFRFLVIWPQRRQLKDGPRSRSKQHRILVLPGIAGAVLSTYDKVRYKFSQIWPRNCRFGWAFRFTVRDCNGQPGWNLPVRPFQNLTPTGEVQFFFPWQGSHSAGMKKKTRDLLYVGSNVHTLYWSRRSRKKDKEKSTDIGPR